MSPKLVAIAVATVLALVGAYLAPLGASPVVSLAAPGWAPPVEFTDIIEYFPSPPPTRQVRGECWTSSNVVTRPNAWRCMVGNQIYDPCFSFNQTAPWVACDVNPLTDGTGVGIRVVLTSPLPDPYEDDTLYAWYVEMADGAKCYAQGRDAFEIEGEWVNYACAGADFLLGEFLQEGEVYYANRVQLTPDGYNVTRSSIEPIRIIWY